MPIFKRTWNSVIIDFIVKLLKSKNLVSNTNYDNIFIIIKGFIKYNKFIPINESHSIKNFINIVIRKIINNYRLPNEFIINKNIIFILQFIIIFITKLRMKNKFSTTFYLQIDRQIKRFNQIVKQYLKYYINYNQNNWVKHLPIIQFIYNISIYISIK